MSATSSLAVTWWGHSSVTVEQGGVRIATDPVLTDRLGHLRRHAPTPTAAATDADLVLVSHLHSDHLHGPSLRRIDPRAVVVVPPGGTRYVRGSHAEIVEASPGDRLELAGVTIDVLAAHHDGRRTGASRTPGTALGFRVHDTATSWWYPGDTGADPAMADVDPVDLALVPIGGWGPTLGPDEHLDPDLAAAAVDLVGARWAVPVHHGTFWPLGLRHVARANHRRLFVTPVDRFRAAMAGRSAEAVTPSHGERVELRIQPGDPGYVGREE